MLPFLRILATAFILFPVLAADARGQRLLTVDGIELVGEAQLLQSGAGTCNVLESDTSYDRWKENQGAPLDIWRLDCSVRNGSGRWLDQLIACYVIESESPDCTNWNGPDAGEFPGIIEWTRAQGNIRESGRNVVAPTQTLTETKFMIVLRGDPEPRFSNWYVDFESAAFPPRAGTAQWEHLFWESIAESTDPAMFEAYLAQFPNGVFHALAEARLVELGASPDGSPAAGGRPGGVAGSPAAGIGAGGGDAPPRRSEVFRDCAECPEMVVMAGGDLAMGRYEVTVGEYRAFASTTGAGAGDCLGDSWRDPGFPQTDRHPVTCVTWNDAQAYVSWLSRRAGATYRLPTEAEWDRAAAGSQRGCDFERTGNNGTCPVGSYGSNAAGLSDMVGNLWEWTEDCWESDCGRRVVRGGAWHIDPELPRPDALYWIFWSFTDDRRHNFLGFRVARTLD